MYKKYFKRLLDIFLSLILIILLAPVFLIVSISIFFLMGRPILFIHMRSGRFKKKFEIYKFRSMRANTNNETDQERITGFGNFLRRWSLDELPQLFNVAKGDMSLVGPRPLLPEYDIHYSDEQNKRFLVRPGVTGLAQVEGRNNLQWHEKFELDVAYVENLVALVDVKILIRTVFVVLHAKNFQKSGESNKFSDLQ